MKRYLTLVLFILLIVSGCKNKDIEDNELSPSTDYPYTYTPLNQQEMAQKLLEFNAVNTFESLKLDEYGMLYGSMPVDLSIATDSSIIKNTISQIIKTYAPFLGITNSDSININTDIRVHLDGGVTTDLSDYFQHLAGGTPTFGLNQNQLNGMKIENARVFFYFSEIDDQMVISGRWYPETNVPGGIIKNQLDVLNLAIQFINENHKEELPIELVNVKKEEFKKVLFPYHSNNGIEMRQCWEVIFWDNQIEILVDTQTGEIINYQQYGYMI